MLSTTVEPCFILIVCENDDTYLLVLIVTAVPNVVLLHVGTLALGMSVSFSDPLAV